MVASLWILKGKEAVVREKTEKSVADLAFSLYILDFFLMPLAYGEIDIEKLPFHACTAMCVMCFLSYRIPFLEKYRPSFAVLGFVSNFVYLIYPAGVMWHSVHPLSYRVIQTLVFHGMMSLYGFLVVVRSSRKADGKMLFRDFTVLGAMTVWALLGNWGYNGTSEGYSHFFNWFFVIRDPFYILPEKAAPLVMPFLDVILFFSAELMLRGIVFLLNRQIKERF